MMSARPPSSKFGVLARERIVGEHARAVVEKGLHDHDGLRFLGDVRERLVGEAEHRNA